MSWIGRWWRNAFRGERVERDLDEELGAYVAMLAEEKIQSGLSPETAWREARMALGGIEQVKENVRDARVGAWLDVFLKDLRYGLRSMRRNPGFTGLAVLTLGLSIGATTAIFSVIDAVLLEVLPYPAPDRLVRLWSAYPSRGNEYGSTSPLDLDDWREASRVFEYVSGYPALRLSGFVWTGGERPEQIETTFVTEDFFETLGVLPVLGRTLVREDHRPGRNQVVVLSHGNWQSRFGGRRGIVGDTLVLSGSPFTVVGVMPPWVEFPYTDSEMWAPLSLIPESGVPRRRDVHWLSVVGRLKPGVSVDEARVEMKGIAARLLDEYPDSNEGLSAVTIRPLGESLVADSRAALFTVFGAVGFVLLIGCANVANLLLARSERRGRELAVRATLGAGRWRLMRQALVESVTLALLGAGVGLLLSIWGVRGLVALAPREIPRLSQVELDGSVLMFNVGVAMVTGIGFGLLPAIRASRADHQEALKEGARGNLGEGRQGARGLLIVVEVAMVVILAIGSGLLIRSFNRLLGVDPGVRTKDILTMSVPAPDYKYPESAQIASFYDEILERVEQVAGVEGVGLVRPLPLRSDTFAGESFAFTIDGRPEALPDDRPRAALRFVSPNYFRTMGIPLISGRDFTSSDRGDSAPVLIINQTAAERYWPGEDPVGARIAVGGGSAPIVGVVGDVRQMGLAEAPTPAVYICYRQSTRRGMTLVVRTRGDPMNVLRVVEQSIRQVNPEQPISNIASMEEIVDNSLSQPRFSMTLLSLFGGLALTLAVIGIYGVVTYSVSRRTHELGLRMALGAHATDVLVLVVRRTVALTGIGIAIGLAGALAATRWMASLLFQVPAYDPWTFLSVSVLLAFVALVAAIVPAVQAARVDPMTALRYE